MSVLNVIAVLLFVGAGLIWISSAKRFGVGLGLLSLGLVFEALSLAI